MNGYKSTAKNENCRKETKQVRLMSGWHCKKGRDIDAKQKKPKQKRHSEKNICSKRDSKGNCQKSNGEKGASKKEPAKKSAAKKEIKIKTYVQYMGRQVEEKDMIAAVKKAWTKENKKKVGDIKDIALYIKPEDGAVYYVVNGTDTGSVQY